MEKKTTYSIEIRYSGKNVDTRLWRRSGFTSLDVAVIAWVSCLNRWGATPGCYGYLYRDDVAIEAFNNRDA